jgi:hypothetical protein
VAGVENNRVSRRIKNSVNRHCGFDNTQVWSKMSAGFGNGLNQMFANFSAQFRQLGIGKRIEVSWTFNVL